MTTVLGESSAAFALVCGVVVGQAPHVVVATTADVAAVSRAIGGDAVDVRLLTSPAADPHFVDARPSMLRSCSRAEALVRTGRDLEIGWLPVLVGNSRNGAIVAGQPGSIDASTAVRALQVPTAGIDRGSGDVHAAGNPHYLVDPLCGLRVAALLRDRFGALWPDRRADFAARFDAFRRRLAVAMVGEHVAAAYGHDAEKLALAFGAGRLADVLHEQGDRDRLGGWFALMLPLRGRSVVADHDIWPYFTERFGLVMVGFFEPKPGVAPTTSHLQELVENMRRADARAILSAPYFAPQHARMVARATGAVIAEMAHQPGARGGDDVDYIDWIDQNVRAVARALSGGGERDR
ncbi:MAG: metal ABC transporter substrate-binding protein [Planctomycetota bacterium]